MIGSKSKHILIHGYTCSSSGDYSTYFSVKCQPYFDYYLRNRFFFVFYMDDFVVSEIGLYG